MNEQELRGILSSNIKRCRLRDNISQIALAEKLEISTNFLSDIERCKAWVSPDTLVRLADALNVEPYELIKPDALLTDKEKDVLQRYSKENIKAVLTVINQIKENFN
ncbi:MAG: helix-turn-helix domain-containing protein [Treponema sp.]|nr:helix-turn-helix domain-containing protein [Treponema sp.]